MPSRFPVEVRRQVVELARSGTKVAQLDPWRPVRHRVWAAQRHNRVTNRHDIDTTARAKPRNRLISRRFRDGRYWARTSDLRLVEAALSQLS